MLLMEYSSQAELKAARQTQLWTGQEGGRKLQEFQIVSANGRKTVALLEVFSKIGTNNLLTRQWSALAICVDKSVLTYDRLNKYQERERVWA